MEWGTVLANYRSIRYVTRGIGLCIDVGNRRHMEKYQNVPRIFGVGDGASCYRAVKRKHCECLETEFRIESITLQLIGRGKFVRERNYAVLADIVLGRCAVRIASKPWGDGSSEAKRSPQFSFLGGKRNQFGDGVGRICEKSCTSACLP